MIIQKALKTALVISVLSIFVGCSDESYSPTSQNLLNEKSREDFKAENINPNVFHGKISLKPGQKTDFSFSNTGFYTFNSIQVLDCDVVKRSIEISGQTPGEALILGCNSKGFKLMKITVLNKGVNAEDLDIFLTGSRLKDQDPIEKQ